MSHTNFLNWKPIYSPTNDVSENPFGSPGRQCLALARILAERQFLKITRNTFYLLSLHCDGFSGAAAFGDFACAGEFCYTFLSFYMAFNIICILPACIEILLYNKSILQEN